MIEQILIAVCGLLTVFLSTSLDFKWRRWASPFGIVAQPAWFYTSIVHEQWGVLILSCLYASRWVQVFYRDWLRDHSAY